MPRVAAVQAVSEPRRAGFAEPSLARLALLPVAAVVIVATRFLFATSMTVAMAVGAPLVLAFVLTPVWASAAVKRFDRNLVTRFVQGDLEGARTLFRKARMMRWFAAPAVVAERRGRIEAEAGEPEAARTAFEEARDAYRGRPPVGVMLGLGDAAYMLEDDDVAIDAYQDVLAWDPTMNRVRVALAHSLIRSARAGEALRWLEGMPEPTREVQRYRLLRAIAHDAAGEEDAARAWRKKAGTPKSPEAKTLRAMLD